MCFTVFNSYDFVVLADGSAPLRCLFNMKKAEYREDNNGDTESEDNDYNEDTEVRIYF